VAWSRHVAPPIAQTSPSALLTLMRRQGVDSLDQLQPWMQPSMTQIDFLAGFSPQPADLIIEKSTPSLFIGTPADLCLRARGIETLVMAGVATDIGVEFTVRHALALGYFAVVVEDAVGSYSEAANQLGLAFLRSVVPVVRSGELLAAWNADEQSSTSEENLT